MATTKSRSTKTIPLAVSSKAPVDVTARDAEGRTPLHEAAFHGYIATVRQLLQQQAEVNARDDQQRTPGHWCAFKGHLHVVKALVDGGADINARDAQGRTWLKMAIIGQKSDVEKYLREQGGEV
ncbi:MAG: ankyrin repeat domain-containing protein [Armatimonadota bacterium]